MHSESREKEKRKKEQEFVSSASPFVLRDRVFLVARFVGIQRKLAVRQTVLHYRRKASRIRCRKLAYKLSDKPHLRKKRTFRPSRQKTRSGFVLPVMDLIDTLVPQTSECKRFLLLGTQKQVGLSSVRYSMNLGLRATNHLCHGNLAVFAIPFWEVQVELIPPKRNAKNNAILTVRLWPKS